MILKNFLLQDKDTKIARIRLVSLVVIMSLHSMFGTIDAMNAGSAGGNQSIPPVAATTSRLFVCTISGCNIPFYREDWCKSHATSRHDGNFKCLFSGIGENGCKMGYNNHDMLFTHIPVCPWAPSAQVAAAALAEYRPFVCMHPGCKISMSQADRRQHERLAHQSERCKCPNKPCLIGFDSATVLKNHMQVCPCAPSPSASPSTTSNRNTKSNPYLDQLTAQASEVAKIVIAVANRGPRRPSQALQETGKMAAAHPPVGVSSSTTTAAASAPQKTVLGRRKAPDELLGVHNKHASNVNGRPIFRGAPAVLATAAINSTGPNISSSSSAAAAVGRSSPMGSSSATTAHQSIRSNPARLMVPQHIQPGLGSAAAAHVVPAVISTSPLSLSKMEADHALAADAADQEYELQLQRDAEFLAGPGASFGFR